MNYVLTKTIIHFFYNPTGHNIVHENIKYNFFPKKFFLLMYNYFFRINVYIIFGKELNYTFFSQGLCLHVFINSLTPTKVIIAPIVTLLLILLIIIQ